MREQKITERKPGSMKLVEGDFTVLSNEMFRDTTLSLKAKGLLSLLARYSTLSDWRFSIEGISSLVPDGKDAIRSGISELEDKGYLIRVKLRNEDGLFCGYAYDIGAGFKLNDEQTDPMSDYPSSENPTTVYPTTVFPTQLNTEILNTEELRTENIEKEKSVNNTQKEKPKKSSHFVKPTLEEVQAYLDEKGYTDVDAQLFWHHYESNGWCVGKNKMVSWHSAIATWRRNKNVFQPQQQKQRINLTSSNEEIQASIERFKKDPRYKGDGDFTHLI